jgi:histidinol-phosphate aminotransferase
MSLRTEQPVDLRHHGDSETAPGLVDLAVNVRLGPPPRWLRRVLTDSLNQLSTYPDQAATRAAVAERHRRPVAEVLLTAGAAEAFVLLARALAPERPLVVHPQFTEPEGALRAAGHDVARLLLAPPFVLDPDEVPADADLVVIGNPTNPTSVLHPADALVRLTRPGRTVIVDEAFADCVLGEPESRPAGSGRGAQSDQDVGSGRAALRLPAGGPRRDRAARGRPTAVAGVDARTRRDGRLRRPASHRRGERMGR